MRRGLAALLAMSALGLVAAPAGQARKATCRGGTTLGASRDVRVYIVGEVDAYVCVKRTGRRHRLADFNGYGNGCVHVCERLSEVRVTRSYVAWLYHYDFSYGGDVPDEHYVDAQVFRVRSGGRVRSVGTSSSLLLLDPHGTTVTLEPLSGGGGTLTARPGTGAPRVLDTGAIAGVTLSGETLSWTNAGAAKQASLR